MKLLVFAHTPPPHHGQSYMVQKLLECLGGDRRQRPPNRLATTAAASDSIECYHVNTRLSRDLEDIGQRPWMKMPVLLKYCLEALWCRFRYNVRNFYYVPAPGMRTAVYRDWLVMALCRPFFSRLVLHWHAAGLGGWLKRSARPWERWITRRLMGQADLSIVLSQVNDPDLDLLEARAEVAIPYGIPDPASAVAPALETRRLSRSATRARLFAGQELSAPERARSDSDPEVVRLLFLGLCTRNKGLFDALDAVALLNRQYAEAGLKVRCRLTVAGKFWLSCERREFEARCAQPDLRLLFGSDATQAPVAAAVQYAGFVSGDARQQLFFEADAFCLPTFYEAESFCLALVEAMAFGLPIVTTRWRAIPDLFPAGYCGLVEPRAPAGIAAALDAVLRTDTGLAHRQRFLANYQLPCHVERMRAALLRLA